VFGKNVGKHLMRGTHIDVHNHQLVKVTFIQGHNIQQNGSRYEDNDHVDSVNYQF
jgi:hypothetical protein